jgi:sensor c-di-GMP phosphodiesterase-like protein
VARKKVAIAVAVLVAVVAVSAPILVSLYLAQQQSVAEQKSRVVQLARDVLRRADQTTMQLVAAADRLEAPELQPPCSPQNVREMARLTLVSEQLLGVGYIADDRLLCSSFGVYTPGIPVGPPDYRTVNGSDARTSVELPGIAGTKFILSTHAATGYTGIVHPNLPLDVFVDDPDVTVGIYGHTAGKLIDVRGYFDPSWLTVLGNRPEAVLFDGAHIVAIRRSTVGDTVAFAAIPAADVRAGLRRIASVLLPIGLIAGGMLAFAVLYVTRLQLSLPSELKMALRRNELFVEYQPVVDLRSGTWVGAEALVRWRRPAGDMVRPDLFIPAAEDAGLIQRITERVVDLVSEDASGLFRLRPDFHIAINLSSADLQSEATVALLARLAHRTGAGPGNLVVELTERGLIKGDDVKARLGDMRKRGVRVAIDDFGTGYSSLSYLKTFDVDLLKIDKSFVDTIGTDAATSQVVFHIIEMAKGLNLELVAEGIENEGQLAFLRERGVHYGQGWLFARPMALTELLRQLAVRRAA